MNAVADLVMQEWEHADEDLVNQSTASLQSLSLSAKQRIGEEMILSKLNQLFDEVQASQPPQTLSAPQSQPSAQPQP